MTNIKSLILILTLTLLLPHSGQSEPVPQPHVEAVLLSANQRLEKAITHSSEEFLKTRKEIFKQLEVINAKKSWFWIRQIDESFFEFYLLKSTDVWQHLSTTHPAQKLRAKLIESLTQKNISLSWLDSQFYGSKAQHGRGVTYALDNKVSIEPIDQLQIHPVLAHELTHLFDADLKDARNGLEVMSLQIDRLYQKPETSWTVADQEFFGRYWFLKNLYLPYFKELRPRINACLVVTDLARLGIIKAGADLDRYKPVMAGTTNCQNFSYQEILSLTGEPKLFWAPNTFYGRIERAYLEQWLKTALQP